MLFALRGCAHFTPRQERRALELCNPAPQRGKLKRDQTLGDFETREQIFPGRSQTLLGIHTNHSLSDETAKQPRMCSQLQEGPPGITQTGSEGQATSRVITQQQIWGGDAVLWPIAAAAES